MRYGQNPLKKQKKSIEPPNAITAGVLNYIPEQVGYFRGQLDSLKLCLASIRHHADRPIDILVVDNGSCTEVRSYLQDELARGGIDYLILNRRNIGKANAEIQILRAAPGDLVFYSDGDIFYKLGWVQAHLDVMNAFPHVGLVGGIPLRNLAEFHTAETLSWIEQSQNVLSYEKGDLIPKEWTREFLRSVNLERLVENWQHLEDCRVTHNGVVAYVGASHMQYLTSREVIQQLPHKRYRLALNSKETQSIDRAIEDAGFLRLSTDRPYVYHLGNVLSEGWILDEFERLVDDVPVQTDIPRSVRRRHWFWGRSKLRIMLKRIHEWAYDMYYQNA